MIVEQIVIDRDNNVDITLAIPIDEDSPESDSVAIASESFSRTVWARLRNPCGCLPERARYHGHHFVKSRPLRQ